jgi:polyhydroxyalkanoate synthesis repressor PhaR
MAQTRRAAPAKPQVPQAAASGPRILKKYPNRRLYDTQNSSYITLIDVKKMVLDGQDFLVRDAKTGEDLTRSILLQIILEEEAGGMPMFSSHALAQIIRFYGHAMQGMMGSYLEKNIQAFAALQKRLGDPAKGSSPELWAQFMSGQAPVMQKLMGDYLEQSKNLFVQMQEQMAEQAKALFPGLQGRTPPKR